MKQISELDLALKDGIGGTGYIWGKSPGTANSISVSVNEDKPVKVSFPLSKDSENASIVIDAGTCIDGLKVSAVLDGAVAYAAADGRTLFQAKGFKWDFPGKTPAGAHFVEFRFMTDKGDELDSGAIGFGYNQPNTR